MEHSSYQADSDEQLIEKLRAGDDEAERALYERFKQTVRSRAHTYFLIGADHEDLVQEGMIGLYKAVCEYDPNKAASFRSFADLCITRQILTAIKNATRKKHSPLNTYVSLDVPKYENDEGQTLFDTMQNLRVIDPEEELIGREEYDRIQTYCRENLSSLEQTVLGMYLGGYSYQQIAQHLDRPPKSIDNALQRIKHKLEALRG
ncbi:MAG: RNA polymerase sporulation sigma factor SigH [Clostridia bacterium]|nr:RNA polymerase sporulation sigma factor SigH [Clostridia bacterium]MBR3271670.1 RNA polymerase sporulation sigma factor SigH [Clostridia bacterium]